MGSQAVDISAVARVVGIKVDYKDLRGSNVTFLPQRVVIIGQGNSDAVYALTKKQITSASQAGAEYGFGSPIHLAARELFPVNGDGVGTIPVTVYPLEEDVAADPSVGDITPTGTQTLSIQAYLLIAGIKSKVFTILAADTMAQVVTKMTTAINSVLEMPVIATDSTTKVDIESKWAGLSANGITISIVAENLDLTVAITQPAGGLVDPDVTDALALMGNIWETIPINCLDLNNTDALDAYQEFGEGRWGAIVRKPMLCVLTGNTITNFTSASAVSQARKTDRINSIIPAPGSDNLPLMIAARAAARIARQANNNPPVDYANNGALTGINPGDDTDQWDYPTRDAVIKRGTSTTELIDGVVELSDVVTCYHPDGDPLPAYRFVVDICKIQQIVFNMSLIFESNNWRGKALIPDADPTVNPDARKPKDAVAAMGMMFDGLGLQAIVSDPKYAKDNTFANISDSNPKRLDISSTCKIAGNSNIISADLNFGFFFGQSQIL